MSNSLSNSYSADEAHQNEFLLREIEDLKAKLAKSEQERMLAKTDLFFASQELTAVRQERVEWEQRRAQLEQRVKVQDERLLQKEEEMEAMRGETERIRREADLMKERLDDCDSKSTFMERLARLIPSQTEMETTGPICRICDSEYNGKRIPKVLSKLTFLLFQF